MSGPKVVRIVTREEIIALCENHLARLDAVVGDWIKIGQRNDTVSEEDIAKVEARRNAIHNLLTKEKFVDLQKQVEVEIAFLHQDTQSRLQKAVERMADTRQSHRRQVAVAATVIKKLESSNHQVPPELRQTLQRAKPGDPDLERAISRAFALLTPVIESENVTHHQRELAKQLSTEETRLTLEGWLSQQKPDKEEMLLRKIDSQIAELMIFDSKAEATRFEKLLQEIRNEPVQTLRELRTDSLMIELSKCVRDRRQYQEMLLKLSEIKAELSNFSSDEARNLKTEIEAVNSAKDSSQVSLLLERATAYVNEETQYQAGLLRRQAILQGLASIGYEVTEGMATAWVENGSLVVKKASNPEYGVELGGKVQSERMQVRVVGFGSSISPRDTTRDRDMETIWCGEFDQLQSLVAKSGGNIVLEKAMPIGKVPLKIIETGSVAATEEVEERNSRLRLTKL